MSKIFISGGCSGIGLSICKKILNDSSEQLLLTKNKTNPPNELISNERVNFINADFSSYRGGQMIAHQIQDELKEITGIIICHGINNPAPIDNTTEADFYQIINNNLASIYAFFANLQFTFLTPCNFQ